MACQRNTLKCISELLLCCAAQTPIVVDAQGIYFVACYQTSVRYWLGFRTTKKIKWFTNPDSGRLIHIALRAADLLEFQVHTEKLPFRCTLETGSIHAVFHQLKRKDTVVLYFCQNGYTSTESRVWIIRHRGRTKPCLVRGLPRWETEFSEGFIFSGFTFSSRFLFFLFAYCSPLLMFSVYFTLHLIFL